MSDVPLRLVHRSFEFAPRNDINYVPRHTRGIYVLYKKRRVASGQRQRFDVVYIGLSTSDIRLRLGHHWRKWEREWTHFSVFAVWDNIRRDEIAELEGLFRHLYRHDTYANALNLARSYRQLTTVRRAARRAHWMAGAQSDIPRQRGQGILAPSDDLR